MCWGKEPETHSQKGRKKAFVPPTLEEVQAYMDQKGEHRFTALRFWNYYEARGWTLGKSKMRFWRRVLDNWAESDINNGAGRTKQSAQAQQDNVVTFHAYKPVDTKGAVSYEEYLRMKGESSFTNHISWEFRLNSRRIQASNPENSGFKLFEINNLYESNDKTTAGCLCRSECQNPV